MKIIIDYLVFTRKNSSLEFFTNILPINLINFQSIKSYYGYENCLYYEGIKIHYGGRPEVCLDLSGKGCRSIESLSNLEFDWLEFFKKLKTEILSSYIHISRLDVACDCFDNELSYDTIIKHLRQNKYCCYSSNVFWSDGVEQSIYFGASKSDRRLRIYNKALEQKLAPGVYWLRLEFQLRNDNALSFLLNFFNQQHIGKTFLGILKDYLRFTKTVVDKENKHQDRSETVSWWKKFLKGVIPLSKIHLEGQHYDLEVLKTFLKRGCGSSILTYLKANNNDTSSLLTLLKDVEINSKQKNLLNNLGVDADV